MKNKYLIICHGYPFESIGGVGQVVRHLVEQLPQKGWDIHVLVPSKVHFRADIKSTPTDWGTLHQLQRSSWRWSKSWNDRSSSNTLLNWISELAPKVCHFHHLNGLPLHWSKELPKHIFVHWTLHDYALPCSRGQLFDRYWSVCSGPTEVKCQDCISPWLQLETDPEIVQQRLSLGLEILHRSDLIDAPSRDLIQRFHHIDPSLTIQLCNLPIDSYIAAKPLIKQSRSLLFVGSLHPSKGLHLLLQAMHHLHQEVHLTIIGHSSNSDLHPSYESTWKNMALRNPNITWIGECSHDEVLVTMESNEILLLPSLWPENSPIVIREALQRGLHVICGLGGSRELSSQITIVDPVSVQGIVNAIQNTIIKAPPKPLNYPTPETVIQEWLPHLRI